MRGGHREGAGRPPKSKERKVPVTLTLTPEQAQYLKDTGNGSALVRRLLQQHIKQNPLPPVKE